MAKQPPKQSPGFSTKAYQKQVSKIAADYKKNSKVVKMSGIQSEDQRSSNEYSKRVQTASHKPKSMTYGASKANKGTTTYKRGKA